MPVLSSFICSTQYQKFHSVKQNRKEGKGEGKGRREGSKEEKKRKVGRKEKGAGGSKEANTDWKGKNVFIYN